MLAALWGHILAQHCFELNANNMLMLSRFNVPSTQNILLNWNETKSAADADGKMIVLYYLMKI